MEDVKDGEGKPEVTVLERSKVLGNVTDIVVSHTATKYQYFCLCKRCGESKGIADLSLIFCLASDKSRVFPPNYKFLWPQEV